MDADFKIRLTRSGRNYWQLVVITDANTSDAEIESDGTSLHGNNPNGWNTDSEDVPLAQFQQSIDPDNNDIPLSHLFRSSKSDANRCASTKEHSYRWCSMKQSVVDLTWKDTLRSGPDEIDSPVNYFQKFLLAVHHAADCQRNECICCSERVGLHNKYGKSAEIYWNAVENGCCTLASLPHALGLYLICDTSHCWPHELQRIWRHQTIHSFQWEYETCNFRELQLILKDVGFLSVGALRANRLESVHWNQSLNYVRQDLDRMIPRLKGWYTQ